MEVKVDTDRRRVKRRSSNNANHGWRLPVRGARPDAAWRDAFVGRIPACVEDHRAVDGDDLVRGCVRDDQSRIRHDSALIGPMQVTGRIGAIVFARNASPRSVGAVTFAIVPLALLTIVLMGGHAWAAVGFCLLYGLSNGIITIVRGTLPQALFGAENYGAIAGAMAGPSLIFKAAGPLAVALIRCAVGRCCFQRASGAVAAFTDMLSGRYPCEARSPLRGEIRFSLRDI